MKADSDTKGKGNGIGEQAQLQCQVSEGGGRTAHPRLGRGGGRASTAPGSAGLDSRGKRAEEEDGRRERGAGRKDWSVLTAGRAT